MSLWCHIPWHESAVVRLKAVKLSKPTVCKAVRVGSTIGPRPKASWLSLRPQACQAFMGLLELSLSTKCTIFMTVDEKSHTGLLLHCNSLGNPWTKAREMLEMSCFMCKILGNGPLSLLHSPIAALSNLNSQTYLLLTTLLKCFQSVWALNFPFNFLLAKISRKQVLFTALV